MNTAQLIEKHKLTVSPWHPENEWNGEEIESVTLWDINTPDRQEQCLESLSCQQQSLDDAVAEAVKNLKAWS